MQDAVCLKGLFHDIGMANISVMPCCEVTGCCKQVTFAAVAGRMGQHEIVSKLQRITSPRDEVVNVTCITYDAPAVEARTLLDITKDRAQA